MEEDKDEDIYPAQNNLRDMAAIRKEQDMETLRKEPPKSKSKPKPKPTGY